ncbi:hypothetical protein [Novosphingobium sp. MMS21-SN21R]|uniref:hypothetical protein n=1 Tax=Novosphingobium sp. MMS21-SN21R TaxID=2969298 RepID=UPI002885F470|nr:hypothetical protein [Novosphingobium sp. MMS21-SN21R]MDT0508475.1 hypothetical protein [Novosphingobium sp. MMS21-SN21R]
MWRATVLLRKRGDISGASFQEAWLDKVAPAIGEAVAANGHAIRALVNAAPESISDALRDVFPPAFDGLLELWFDDAASAVSCLEMLRSNPVLRDLALPVIDGAAGVLWLAQAFPIKPEAGSAVKFLAGGDVAVGVPLDVAQAYYREEHPRVAQTAPKVWEPLTRYTQFHGRPDPHVPDIDWLAAARFVPMCSDMGFADIGDFLKVYGSDQYARIVRPDEQKFSRPGEMLSFISAEERVLFDRA